MQPSQLNTISLPTVGAPNPGLAAKAAQVPLRVLVRNSGPILVLLAHDQGTLQNTPVSANAFPLPPDKDYTFVLVPGQALYAAGFGAGGQIAVAISEAIPTKWMEA